MLDDQPLRILHCFRSPVGGIFRHVRDLAKAQAAAGHMVGIVCDSTTGGAHEARLFETIAPSLALGIHRTPIHRHVGAGDIVAACRTFRIMRGLQPDVLHGHGAKGGAYARVFGSLLRWSNSRAVRIYSPHGGSLHYDRQKLSGRLMFASERLLERFATDCLLFVSDDEAKTYSLKVGRPLVPFRRVYNGLHAEEFTPVVPNDDAADFLYVGMMRDLKGPDIFIEALAHASEIVKKPLCAIMVGDGDGLPKYFAQVQALGITGQVTFRPAMPARAAFSLGRVLVIPSRAEAMPYIVLEALAARIPMLASAVGGIPEILGDNSASLVEATPISLARRLAETIDGPDLLRSALPDISEMQSRFSADSMAEEIERAYRDVSRR